MSLAAGTRLGPYEIAGPIGAGGMGEVYRARDTKLDRDVAIKVLPEELASDAERVARFEREAKLLASLNHPNIAGIYGFEENAIVLELIEGPTLAERIAQGPIPVDEAIAIAKQIAEALEAGHEAGVIHRDLKPANIKVKDDGTVKVLDYGLAKALEGDAPASADSELSQSPTLTRQGTQIGVILGTAAYMSPEQARGKPVDKRADIWSFGAVLYEMLTGRRAFEAEDVSLTLAAVMTSDPELESLPETAPPRVETAIRGCLTKDPARRIRDIGDVRLALEGVFETASASPDDVVSKTGWTPAVALVVALVVSTITGFVVWISVQPADTPRPVARFSIPLPSGTINEKGGLDEQTRPDFALSPDGARVAFSTNDRLYTRAMDEMDAIPIPGTEGARAPFFSPDGEWIGFWAKRQLHKITIDGGTAVPLTEQLGPSGASWSNDDTILFTHLFAHPTQRISADGGEPEPLVAIPETGFGGLHPQMLPGGNAVLLTMRRVGLSERQIEVHSLLDDTRKVLVERGGDATYVPTGHLAYVSEGTLWAVPFDLDELEVTGGPVPMVEGLKTGGGSGRFFSISASGALAYVPGRDVENRKLVLVDRNGREEELAAPAMTYTHPRFSPDGRRIAVDGKDQGEDELWIWDLARDSITRFTFAPGRDSHGVWSPDGKTLTFSSNRDGVPNLYRKAADGIGPLERLTESEDWQWPSSFSSDGEHLVFWGIGQSNTNLGILTRGGAAQPLIEDTFLKGNPVISPDGRWLAYDTDAPGRHEVLVRPFPNVEDGQWLVSSGGGEKPAWSPDGKELFYIAPGAKLMSVPVETGDGFTFGRAELIVEGYWVNTFHRTYDVSPDGERFVMIKRAEESEPTELVIVLNWIEELKRRVPVN